MSYINFLIENWYMIIVLLAIAGFIGVMIGRFMKLPKNEQIAKVKEWLLYAVTEAEKELGGGTGKLKLRQVYDLFVQRFPKIAMVVSFDTFALWVDDALTEMRKMIAENKSVSQLVNGGDGNVKN